MLRKSVAGHHNTTENKILSKTLHKDLIANAKIKIIMQITQFDPFYA